MPEVYLVLVFEKLTNFDLYSNSDRNNMYCIYTNHTVTENVGKEVKSGFKIDFHVIKEFVVYKKYNQNSF